MLDPLRFAIAAVPLGAYLVLIGLMNLGRRPVLASGAGDLGALGAALTGVALVGPIALFRPEPATAELGAYVWLFLLAFYWLWVALAVMLCRPRLVVYNLSAEQLRPVLSEAARKLDSAGRWAGEGVVLPGVGVQGHLDPDGWMRHTSIVATGGRQDLAGWRKLARAVERELRDAPTEPHPLGWALAAMGAGLIAAATWGLAADPEGVAVAWRQAFVA